MFSGEGCGLTEPISKELCSASAREFMEWLEHGLRSKIDGVETISIDDVTDKEHVSQGAKDGRAIADAGLQIRLVIVATGFDGLGRIDRHRLVNEVCGDSVINGRIHSLEIRALTPKQLDSNALSSVESQKRVAGNITTSVWQSSARSGKQESMNTCDCGKTSMHAVTTGGGFFFSKVPWPATSCATRVLLEHRFAVDCH